MALAGCGENRWIGDFIRVNGRGGILVRESYLEILCIFMSLWSYCSKLDADGQNG